MVMSFRMRQGEAPSTCAASSISSGMPAEVEGQHQGREGQRQHRVDRDQRPVGIDQPEGLHDQVVGHGDGHGRDQPAHQDEVEGGRAPGEAEAGVGVGRQAAEDRR